MKSLIFILCSFFVCVSSHVFMQSPPSRRSKYHDYYVSTNNVDYNIMAPLNTPGYKFPCKGFPKGPATEVTTSIEIVLEGTAIHQGGHCQFGISKDDDTFLVLQTVLGDCLLGGMNFNLQLPDHIPSGEWTLFWTWINKVGNREYYMECADISITNPNGDVSKPVFGKELLVVNLPGFATIPEFPSNGMYDGRDLLQNRRDISVDFDVSVDLQSVVQQKQTPFDTQFTCSTGEVKCVDQNVALCVHNMWIYKPCPARCVEDVSSIWCEGWVCLDD
jgi:hypothetical protein